MLSHTLNEFSECYLNDNEKWLDESFRNILLDNYKKGLKTFLKEYILYNSLSVSILEKNILAIIELEGGFQIYLLYDLESRYYKLLIGVKHKIESKFFIGFVKDSFKKYRFSSDNENIIISGFNISNLHNMLIRVKLKESFDIIDDVFSLYNTDKYYSSRNFFMLNKILNEVSNCYLKEYNKFSERSYKKSILTNYENYLRYFLNSRLFSFNNIIVKFIKDELLASITLNYGFQIIFDYNLKNKLLTTCIKVPNNSEFKFFLSYVNNMSEKYNFSKFNNNLIISEYSLVNSYFVSVESEFNENIKIIKNIYAEFSKDYSHSVKFKESTSYFSFGYSKSEINNVYSFFKKNCILSNNFDFNSSELPFDELNDFHIKSFLSNGFANDNNYISNIRNYFSIKPNDIILIGSENTLFLIGVVKSSLNQIDLNFNYEVNWIYDNEKILKKFRFKNNEINVVKSKSWNDILMNVSSDNSRIKQNIFNEIFNEFNENYDEINKKYKKYIENSVKLDEINNLVLFKRDKSNLLKINYPSYVKYFKRYLNIIENNELFIKESFQLGYELKKINSNSYDEILRGIFKQSHILDWYSFNKNNISKLPKQFIICLYDTYKSASKYMNLNKPIRDIINMYKKCIKNTGIDKFGHTNVFLSLLLFYNNLYNNFFEENYIYLTLKFFGIETPRIYEYTSIKTFLKENFDLYEKRDLTNLKDFLLFSLWMKDNYLRKKPPILPYDVLIFEEDYSNEFTEVFFNSNLMKENFADFKISNKCVNKISSALNAGKHIILKGSCGTGKTDLALRFSNVSLENKFIDGYILTTATSDWSTFDTIGGLIPDENGTLVFNQGKVLEAIALNKWLIIDEINRADIDKAFGQLFTVLSGHDVELPYEENNQPISIKLWDKSFCQHDEETATYYIGKNWRIIGTMNVDDKDSLFDLSYAFMRRFMFIEVDLPNEMEYKSLIKFWTNELDEFYQNKLLQLYDIVLYRSVGPAIFKDIIEYISVRVNYGASDDSKILSEAINAYIVPQLEGLHQNEISDIKSFLLDLNLLDHVESKLDDLILDI